MKLLVIGAGNMGMSYAHGIAKSDIEIDRPILLLEHDEAKVLEFNKTEEFKAFNAPKDCVAQADIILLAVKPQVFKEVAAAVAPFLQKETIIISIMAGVTSVTIAELLSVKNIARAMPNLPAQIGLGMTSVFFVGDFEESNKQIVQEILASTGEVIPVKTEDDIDKSTGISGSGPAYIFYFIEALENAAKEMGFSAEDSKKLATQTFLGAIELYRQNDLSPEEWMNRVASKGGTTRAALDSFANEEVSLKIIKGAFAAYNRAVELGKT